MHKNGRYYLLNVTEEGDEKVATLHLADDPRVPLYEVQDKQVLPNTSLLESFEVSADHKLILK